MKKARKLNYIHFVITYNFVLLIPMIIVFCSVFIMEGRQQVQKIETMLRSYGEREEEYWHQQMSVVNFYNTECRYDKRYNSYYAEKPPGYFLDIETDLKQKEENFPFVENIYLYQPDRERVLSSGGLYEADYFFQSICMMERDFPEEQEAICARKAVGKRQQEKMVLICPLRTWGKSGENEVQYLLFTITRARLKELFGISEFPESGVTRIIHDGVILYELGRPADGLEEEKDYLTYTRDLDSGFRVIQMIPKDVVYKNMEPFLKGYGIWFGCSVVTGFGLALYFSRRRYRSFQWLMENNEELEEERNRLRAEKCLYELLRQDIQEGDELWKSCLENGIYVNRRYKFFVIVPQDSERNQEICDFFNKQMSGSSITTAYPLALFEEARVYLICSDETRIELEQKRDRCSKMGADIGIGELCMDISRIRQSYREASRALRSLDRTGKGYPEVEMNAFREAVELGDTLRADVLLEGLFDTIKEVKETAAVCILWDMLRMAELDPELLFEEEKDGLVKSADRWKERIREALSCRKEQERPQQAEAAGGYRKKNIVDVLTYIHEHYLEDNFSVKYMASEFETSVSNLSHFFKKNQGMSISQYVENIKMERARELLEESDRKVSEIAQLLRYGSSTVFIEVFKKQTGMTPGAYREQIRKQDF